MLKGSFFDIVSKERTETGDRVTVRLNPSHDIFKGHFPGYPITPGVCIVQMATEISSQLQNRPLEFVGAKDIKFLTPIFPAQTPELCFDFSGPAVTVFWEETIFARLKLELVG